MTPPDVLREAKRILLALFLLWPAITEEAQGMRPIEVLGWAETWIDPDGSKFSCIPIPCDETGQVNTTFYV